MLTLMKLENRIVLDGAGGIEAVGHLSDHAMDTPTTSQTLPDHSVDHDSVADAAALLSDSGDLHGQDAQSDGTHTGDHLPDKSATDADSDSVDAQDMAITGTSRQSGSDPEFLFAGGSTTISGEDDRDGIIITLFVRDDVDPGSLQINVNPVNPDDPYVQDIEPVDSALYSLYTPNPGQTQPPAGYTGYSWVAYYTPEANVFHTGTDSSAALVTVTGDTLQRAKTYNITIVPQNDAPVLLDLDENQDGMHLNPISEDIPNDENIGTSVTDIIASSDADVRYADVLKDLPDIGPDHGAIWDADGDPEGIAVVGVDNYENGERIGTWQYSVDNGNTWADLDAQCSVTNATLLGPDARIRFVPVADYNGSATNKITILAWDGTGNNPTNGAALASGDTGIDTTAWDPRPLLPGDQAPFSLEDETIGVHVEPTNDRPELSDMDHRLDDIQEDLGDILGGDTPQRADVLNGAHGNLVSEIVVDGSITDPDLAEAPESIAITGVDNANGTWEYSLDDGATWHGIDDGNLSNDHALLLTQNARIRFVPHEDFNANMAPDPTFTFKAWDQSQGSEGQYADTTDSDNTAFSLDSDTAAVHVTPVNDSPILDPAFDHPAQDWIIDMNNASDGRTIGDLITDGAITEKDTATDETAVESIAIIAVDEADKGQWEYSLDGGATWLRVDNGNLSENNALLLTADSMVRFVPAASFKGTATFTFRAWDMSDGASAGDRVTIPDTAADRTQPFSNDTDIVSIRVRNVPPDLNPDFNPALTDAGEDLSDPAGHITDDTLANFQGDLVSDIIVDGSITDGGQPGLESIAIIAIDNTRGTWQYSTDGGATWQDMDAAQLDGDTGLLLSQGDRIRFIPNEDYNQDHETPPGSYRPTFTFRAWDETEGSHGDYYDIVNPGQGDSPFSEATDTVSVPISPINDAPLLDPNARPELTQINSQNGLNMGDLVSDIIVDGSITEKATAQDETAVDAIAVIAVDNNNGIWQYSMDGGQTWISIDDGQLSNDHALLLTGDARIRFSPQEGFNGEASFTFRAWDRSDGFTPGTYASANPNGGITAFSEDTNTAWISAYTGHPEYYEPGPVGEVVELIGIGLPEAEPLGGAALGAISFPGKGVTEGPGTSLSQARGLGGKEYFEFCSIEEAFRKRMGCRFAPAMNEDAKFSAVKWGDLGWEAPRLDEEYDLYSKLFMREKGDNGFNLAALAFKMDLGGIGKAEQVFAESSQEDFNDMEAGEIKQAFFQGREQLDKTGR